MPASDPMKFDPFTAPPRPGAALAQLMRDAADRTDPIRAAATTRVLGRALRPGAAPLGIGLAANAAAFGIGPALRAYDGSPYQLPGIGPRAALGGTVAGDTGKLTAFLGIGEKPTPSGMEMTEVMEQVDEGRRLLADGRAAERRAQAKREALLLAETQHMRRGMETLTARANQERQRADEEAAARARSEAREERQIRIASRTCIVAFLSFLTGAGTAAYVILA